MRDPAYIVLLSAIALTAGCTTVEPSLPATGTLELSVATGGVETDGDGYTIRVDGGQATPISSNAASVDLGELTDGDHTVELAGVSANCTVLGENPRTVHVSEGQKATLEFQVACSASSGTVSKILFESIRAGQYDVFTMNPDGSAPTNLTPDFPESDLGAVWSPDGSRIAFTAGAKDIYVMNADGSNRVDLTPGAMTQWSLSWSPDGRRILFSAGNDLKLLNVDGSGETFLVTGYSAVWSPDGSRVAFIRDGSIFAINIDGTGEVRLSSPGLEEEDADPRWSPDGGKIAFVRGDHEDSDGWINSNLWVMNSDGSNAVALTHFFFRCPNGLIYGHAWSPNGERLAFGGYSSGGQDILLVNPDGTGLVNLTNNYTWLESEPSWSPDGSRILFSAEPRDPETLEGGPAEIFVMGSDGSNFTNLSNNSAIDVHPVWQP